MYYIYLFIIIILHFTLCCMFSPFGVFGSIYILYMYLLRCYIILYKYYTYYIYIIYIFTYRLYFLHHIYCAWACLSLHYSTDCCAHAFNIIQSISGNLVCNKVSWTVYKIWYIFLAMWQTTHVHARAHAYLYYICYY